MDEFEEFFEASRDRVFRAVLALVGDPSLAETAVIDAYTAAYRAWLAGQSGTTSEAWVLRSALSGRGPRRREPSEPSPSTDEPAPDLTSAQERAEAARVAVRRLPRRLRGVIAIHLVAGLSAKETAALVGLPPDTVDGQLVAGLALLRQVMVPGSEATEPEEEDDDTGPVDVSYDLDASYELGVPLATRIFARAPKPVVVVVTDDEVTAWVIDAFADQHLDASLPDLEPEPPRSRLRRRRDWVIPLVAVPAIAVAVAAVLLAVLGGFGRLLGSTPAAAGSASPAAATPCRGCDWDEPAFATDCLGKWANAAPRASDLRPQDRAIVPPLRFAFRDAQYGVRLFATGTVLFTCTRDEAGQARGVISGRPAANESFLPDTPSPLDYLAVLDLSGGPEYLLGRLPDGARRVVARNTQGQEIPGVINGDLFAVWAPHGGLAGAQVHAYAGNREISSGPPTFLRGGFNETAFTQACGVRILDLLQAAEDLPPAEREVPPVRFRWREGEWAMWFYGTDRTLLECKLLPNGAIEVSGGWFDVNQGWSTMQPLDLQSDVGRLGWAFGRAIDGAERIEVNLSDGRVVFAQVKDGVFAAAWFNGVDTNVGPQTVTALTPDLIYSRDAAGTLSTRPR